MQFVFADQSLSNGRSADSRRGSGCQLWTIAVCLRHRGHDQRTACTDEITDHKLSHARPWPGPVAGNPSQVHIQPESETGTGCVIFYYSSSWLFFFLLRLSLLSVKILLDLREFLSKNACADKSRQLAGKNRQWTNVYNIFESNEVLCTNSTEWCVRISSIMGTSTAPRHSPAARVRCSRRTTAPLKIDKVSVGSLHDCSFERLLLFWRTRKTERYY